MSVEVWSEVWRSGPSDHGELLVLLALADFANPQGECWPAVATIAEKTRMTDRGVQKILKRLIEAKRISVTVGGGRRNCNLYRILQNPEQETPNTVHPEHGSPRTPEHKPRTRGRETPNRRSPEPSGTVNEPSVERDARASGFSEFWDVYPHRGEARRKRKDAEALYQRLVRDGVPEPDILDGAARYRSDGRVQRGYARDAVTWLSQRGWEDEIEPARPKAKAPGSRRGMASLVAEKRLTEDPRGNEPLLGDEDDNPFGDGH